ncbi:hypothetical protein ACHMW4_02050 [Mesorhizobium sp. UC22_110]|uniref:hypothetical protein n=1 Tax=unclassified Mesorhizobium TaxID=325217 RepID=UPI0036701F75
MHHPNSFSEALQAPGPFAAHADKLALYGRFVGAWSFDAKRWTDDGKLLTGHGEIHFGWALEGRAIQDVWILPARNAGPSPELGPWTFYGTTLRIYDPGIDAWHILWSDPRTQYHSRQTGRAEGADIVQIGGDGSGTRTRWRFTEITDNSFRWLGERADGEGDWNLQVEFLARRAA